MRKGTRVGLILAAALTAVIVIAGIVFLWFVRRPLPDTRGSVSVAGISAPVEIFRDEDGVPHIWAQTAEDLYFGQGYVHAQDRFWQMEFWRRIGAGRLSEILGEAAVDQDRYLRTMGFARVAEQEYRALPPELRSLLDAYALGVNAYTAGRKPGQLGLEFGLLKLTGVDVEIEPWTGVNSLTWAKIMALDLGLNMGNEFSNLSLVRFGGTELFKLIRTPYRSDMPFIVTMEEVAAFRREAGLPVLPEPPQPMVSIFTGGNTGIGSNNWVIGPERTSTGAPILANDMHLAVQIPSIWYEVGLHLQPPEGSAETALNLRGFSFAGVPGIIAGQNDHVAWGMTNLGGDVQDLYVERVNPDNPDQYWDGEQWRDMQIRLEAIQVEGEDEPVVQRVRETPRGPILTDLPQMSQWFSFETDGGSYPEGTSFTELSLRWTALEPETLWQAVVELNRAQSAGEVREALREWASPAQNLVFADDQGNIGYQSTGAFPDRNPAFGRAPSPGWEYQDPGMVPYSDYPAALNPEKGYIVTANNPVVSWEYPYPLGIEFANGLRAKRIVERIEEFGTDIGPEEVREIHADVYNRSAAELIPFLDGVDLNSGYDAYITVRTAATPTPYPNADGTEPEESRAEDLAFVAQAFDMLAGWDYLMESDSPGAAAFGFVWKALIEQTFEDEVPAHAWPFAGVTTFESALHAALDIPEHTVWDDRSTGDVVETRDDILARAVVAGLLAAREELGERPERWEWGDIHQIEFRNATLGESGVGIIERLFNRGPFQLGGGTNTVNVAHWSLREPFAVTSIASERAIYDLADPSNSRFTHPTGQSGHAFDRDYFSFFQQWRDVEYHPARFTREEVVVSAGRRRILLEPARAE